MAQVIVGERAGKDGRLGVGISAAVFEEGRERILPIRRTDNGKWTAPGGYMELGESLTEACAREFAKKSACKSTDTG